MDGCEADRIDVLDPVIGAIVLVRAVADAEVVDAREIVKRRLRSERQPIAHQMRTLEPRVYLAIAFPRDRRGHVQEGAVADQVLAESGTDRQAGAADHAA